MKKQSRPNTVPFDRSVYSNGACGMTFAPSLNFSVIPPSNPYGCFCCVGCNGDDNSSANTGFSIGLTFPSVADMLLDTDTPTGKLAIITSNVEDEDNAKVFVKTDDGWDFVVDLSGATGRQGSSGTGGNPDQTNYGIVRIDANTELGGTTLESHFYDGSVQYTFVPDTDTTYTIQGNNLVGSDGTIQPLPTQPAQPITGGSLTLETTDVVPSDEWDEGIVSSPLIGYDSHTNTLYAGDLISLMKYLTSNLAHVQSRPDANTTYTIRDGKLVGSDGTSVALPTGGGSGSFRLTGNAVINSPVSLDSFNDITLLDVDSSGGLNAYKLNEFATTLIQEVKWLRDDLGNSYFTTMDANDGSLVKFTIVETASGKAIRLLDNTKDTVSIDIDSIEGDYQEYSIRDVIGSIRPNRLFNNVRSIGANVTGDYTGGVLTFNIADQTSPDILIKF